MNSKLSGVFYKQRGAALLIFFLLIFSVASTVLLAGLNNRSPSLQKDINIQNEMALAKEAMLAYAFNYADLFPASNNGPGRFPCTDSTNNGLEDCLSSGARLPESLVLQSGDPFQLVNTFANIDQQFWYYISPFYVRNAATSVNSTTTTSYTVDSQTDIVAVILAPGDPLSSQDRSIGPLFSSNYLEASNLSGSNFTNANPADPANFNDQALGITRSELMSLVTVKVAIELKTIFDEFHLNSGAYPINIEETDEALAGDLVPPGSSGRPDRGRPDEPGGSRPDNPGGVPPQGSGSPAIPVWFYSDQWDLVTSYSYDTDSDIIQYSFANCAITFTLNFDSDLDINPKRC